MTTVAGPAKFRHDGCSAMLRSCGKVAAIHRHDASQAQRFNPCMYGSQARRIQYRSASARFVQQGETLTQRESQRRGTWHQRFLSGRFLSHQYSYGTSRHTAQKAPSKKT